MLRSESREGRAGGHKTDRSASLFDTPLPNDHAIFPQDAQWRVQPSGLVEIWTEGDPEWTDSICSLSDLEADKDTFETDANGEDLTTTADFTPLPQPAS